jgi:hypothetical protein
MMQFSLVAGYRAFGRSSVLRPAMPGHDGEGQISSLIHQRSNDLARCGAFLSTIANRISWCLQPDNDPNARYWAPDTNEPVYQETESAAIISASFLSTKLTRFDVIGWVGASGSVLRRIPCSGPESEIKSLLARINSLLVRTGNSSASDRLKSGFRDGFCQKRPIRRNSLHFSLRPGNPAHQQIVNLSAASRREPPTVGNGECSKNTHPRRRHTRVVSLDRDREYHAATHARAAYAFRHIMLCAAQVLLRP